MKSTPPFAPLQKCGKLIASLFLLSLVHSAAANTIFSLSDVIRPGGAGTANTLLLGTGLAVTPSLTFQSTPLTLNFSGNGATMIIHFDPTELSNIGDKVTLSYTGVFSGFDGLARGLRIGLMSHGTGTILTSDQSSVSVNGYKGYNGYVATFRSSAINSSSEVFRRDPTQTNPVSGSGGATTIGTPTQGFNITNGTSYSGSFSLEKTGANELTITTQFGAQIAQSFIDTNSITTPIDTFAFAIAGNAGNTQSVVFTQLSVTVIPEPGTGTLVLTSLGGLVMLQITRRKRSSLWA